MPQARGPAPRQPHETVRTLNVATSTGDRLNQTPSCLHRLLPSCGASGSGGRVPRWGRPPGPSLRSRILGFCAAGGGAQPQPGRPWDWDPKPAGPEIGDQDCGAFSSLFGGGGSRPGGGSLQVWVSQVLKGEEEAGCWAPSCGCEVGPPPHPRPRHQSVDSLAPGQKHPPLATLGVQVLSPGSWEPEGEQGLHWASWENIRPSPGLRLTQISWGHCGLQAAASIPLSVLQE